MVDNLPMTVVNTNLPANLFVQPTDLLSLTADLRQVQMRLDQVLRATVVESSMHKAVLEMDEQLFEVRSDKQLALGTELRLQVSQVQPNLEFHLLNDSISGRLSQLLPLLTRSHNWNQEVTQLQQHPLVQQSDSSLSLVTQLGQILGGSSTNDLAGQQLLARLTQQLALPAAERYVNAAQGENSLPVLLRGQSLSYVDLGTGPLDRIATELTVQLQRQLSDLQQLPARSAGVKAWMAQTRGLLIPLKTENSLVGSIGPTARTLLFDTLSQIHQQPKITPQLAVEVKVILTRLEQQNQHMSPPQQQLSRPAAAQQVQKAYGGQIQVPLPAQGAVVTPESLAAIAPSFLNQSAAAAADDGVNKGMVTAAVTAQNSGGTGQADVEQLIGLLKQAQQEGKPLAPALLGRIEGLLTRVQQQPELQAELMAQFARIEQLVVAQSHHLTPQQQNLGMLAQLFGFHLESELLQGKQRAALVNLKQTLLKLRSEAGEDVTEPLRRIELFQMVRARLADEQIYFMPLPFDELEEGYLLAQKREEQPQYQQREALNMSLSLKLSELGNIRIDLLYNKEEGLQMQIAGEDEEKKRYLESCADEWKQAISAVTVRDVSFSADAEQPTAQLQQRLLPERSGVLDTRV